MVFPNLRAPITPRFDIFINGQPLSNQSFDAFSHIVRLVVDDDTELPSMFTLEFTSAEDSENLWLNDYGLFAIGAEVEIQVGYDNNIETLILGEITGLEPRFSVSDPLSLIVRGYDRRHRLQRGRKTRSFVDQKDSDIAARIAQEVSLSPNVTDSSVLHPYVLQANQTDWEFLQQRAKQIQYEVVVEGKTLFFRPVNNSNSAELTLSLDDYLLEFCPYLSSVGQVNQVTVRGWDFQQNAVISGNSSTVTNMGGRRNGAELSSQAFGNAIAQISNHPIMSQSEADQLAVAQLNRTALNLITGEGVCLGSTNLRAGRVIEIKDIGLRFSGRYYVTSASHRYSYEGYYTHFCVRRNAS
ncbi:MAG: contractile injection system protein, VgrG/Pvc8 family [Scytonema sp. PMC 1069.18]|nr:contractile injection system protein, VgrG/Pvc8 family [Scytonema sp. PMC 1069.18]MEC4883959.1 contractile injection system protein, VgrG/Pvc8 family [Scytonema sp. PMC 1070.18]